MCEKIREGILKKYVREYFCGANGMEICLQHRSVELQSSGLICHTAADHAFTMTGFSTLQVGLATVLDGTGHDVLGPFCGRA